MRYCPPSTLFRSITEDLHASAAVRNRKLPSKISGEMRERMSLRSTTYKDERARDDQIQQRRRLEENDIHIKFADLARNALGEDIIP
jgi:hypothetical protein